MDKKLLKFKGLIILIFLSLANQYSTTAQQQITFDWAKKMGGTGSDIARNIITDKDNNIIVSGTFSGTANFNTTGGTDTLRSNGGTDGFVSKLRSDGSLIWAVKLGSSAAGSEQIYGVDTDDKGNIYVAGYFTNSIDLNPDPVDSFMFYTRGGNDIFIVKLNPEGKFIWGKRMGGTSQDIARSVKVAKNGNVLITGNFASKGDFNFNTGTNAGDTFKLATLSAGTDMYLACLDSLGNFKWVNHVGNIGIDDVTDITLDKEDNIYMSGTYRNHLYLNPDTNNLSASSMGITALGTTNIFVARFSPIGKLHWTKSMGGYDASICIAMAATPEGDFFLTGTYLGINFFGVDTLIGTKTLSEIFISRLDSSGNFKWTKPIKSSKSLVAYSLAVDKFENLYYTGYFQGTYYFKKSNEMDSLVSTMSSATAYGYDTYVAKLNPSGNHEWVRKNSQSKGGKASYNLHADNNGNIYSTGYFSDRSDFNSNANVADSFFITSSGIDVFVHKMTCNDTNSIYIQAVSCSKEYSFMNDVIKESGTYIKTLPNQYGCDSSVVLHLLIDELDPIIRINGFELSTAIPYVSYQWIKDGTIIPGATSASYTVTENGDYRVYVTNDNNCSDTSDNYVVSNVIVGVSDPSTLSQLVEIYPNPTSGMLYISSPQKVWTTIYSIEGKTILKTNDRNIDLQKLAEGIYMVQITDEKGYLIKTNKIIKQLK